MRRGDPSRRGSRAAVLCDQRQKSPCKVTAADTVRLSQLQKPTDTCMLKAKIHNRADTPRSHSWDKALRYPKVLTFFPNRAEKVTQQQISAVFTGRQNTQTMSIATCSASHCLWFMAEERHRERCTFSQCQISSVEGHTARRGNALCGPAAKSYDDEMG